jgi:hypothetical protein
VLRPGPAPPVLIGSFQRQRFYRAAAPRWADLARSAEQTVIFADFKRSGGSGAAGSARTQARPPGGYREPGSAQGKGVLSRDGRAVRFGSPG